MRTPPIAPLAACSLVLGWAAVAASGSRPLGGIVLLACGTAVALLAGSRHGARAAARVAAAGLAAFIASHLLALLTGAWPAVLLTAAALGAYAWLAVDTRTAAEPRLEAVGR